MSDPANSVLGYRHGVLKHEGLAKLVRDRPEFAADLLSGLLAVKVPAFSKAQLVDVTLNQVRPAEYRADAVVLFARRKPARKAIEMQPGLQNFFSEAQRRNFERGRATGKAEGEAKGKAEGKAEGEAEGEAAALLKILMRRGLVLTAAQRRRIVGCTDLATLERWLDRSLSVRSVEGLLASPARASSNGHRRGRSVPVRGRRKSR